MTYDTDDTIAAIGTAPGGSLRGMIRLSGPRVVDCLECCFRSTDGAIQLADVASPSVLAGSFDLGDTQLPCEVFFWPTQRSYTRQPTAELHTLGSPPLLEKVLRTVCDCGARLAEPGEFTLRAFLAGRLDLTQAEAVLGVIDAQSSSDLRTALTQLAGGLSQPLSQLREELLQLLAELEAGLDFVEEDIEFITAEQMRQQLTSAQSIVGEVAKQLHSREDASDLPRVVLSGLPNAGKSSLFNALISRHSNLPSDQQALVSDQSGTTRDFVTAPIRIQDIDCELIDTAGIESVGATGSIDQLAQVMTSQQRDQAHLVIRCEEARSENIENLSTTAANEIVALTKVDLFVEQLVTPTSVVRCSSVDGTGLDELCRQIYEKLTDKSCESKGSLSSTASRCVECLHNAQESLTQALQLVEVQGGEELIAAEVRGALNSLGQVVGVVYTDDILDRIFGQFCIGK